MTDRIIRHAIRGIKPAGDNLAKEYPVADWPRPQKADKDPTSPSRVFRTKPTPRQSGDGDPSTPNKKGESKVNSEPNSQGQVQKRASQDKELEERKRRLLEEREKLTVTVSEMEDRNSRQKLELESLLAIDEAEKWEDDLREMRQEELRDVSAQIKVNSSTSPRDIHYYIKQLNGDIWQSAKNVVEMATKKAPEAKLEEVISSKVLGPGFLGLFPDPKAGRSMERSLVQAILQIFITRSCLFLLESWNLNVPKSSKLLNRLYDYIRNTEEEMVATKWRQFTFVEVPHGPDTKVLQEYASYKAKGVMEILACAGWDRDPQKVQNQMSWLLMRTERLRMNVKGIVIYNDYQPWIAAYDDKYDGSTMFVTGSEFGIPRVRVEGSHVLGSTELGWKVGGDVKRKPRVILIESLGDRLPRPMKKALASTTT